MSVSTSTLAQSPSLPQLLPAPQPGWPQPSVEELQLQAKVWRSSSRRSNRFWAILCQTAYIKGLGSVGGVKSPSLYPWQASWRVNTMRKHSARETIAQGVSSAGKRARGPADLPALLSCQPPRCPATSKGPRASTQAFLGHTQAGLVLPYGEVQREGVTTANSSTSSSFSPINARRLGSVIARPERPQAVTRSTLKSKNPKRWKVVLAMSTPPNTSVFSTPFLFNNIKN